MLSQPIRTVTVIGLVLILKLDSYKKLPLRCLLVPVEANKSSPNQTHKSQHVNSRNTRVSNKKGGGSSSSSKRNLADRYSDEDQNYKPQLKAQSRRRRRRSNTIERSTASSYSYDHTDNSSSSHSMDEMDFDTLQLASDSDSRNIDFNRSNTSQESSRIAALSESLYNNLSQDEHEEDIINALLSSHSDTILDSTGRNHSPLSSPSSTSLPRNQYDIHHRRIHRKSKVSKSNKKSDSTTTQSSPSLKKTKRRKSSSRISMKSHDETDTTTKRRDGDGENIPIKIINNGDDLHYEETLISSSSISSSIPTANSYMNHVSVDIQQSQVSHNGFKVTNDHYEIMAPSQSSLPTENMLPTTNKTTKMNTNPSRTLSEKLETLQKSIRPYISNYLHGQKIDQNIDGTFSTSNDATHHGDKSRSGTSVDEAQTSPPVSLIGTSAPNMHTSTAYPPTTQSMFTNTHIHIQQEQTTSSYPSKDTTTLMQTDSRTSLQTNKQEDMMNPNISQSSSLLYSSPSLPPRENHAISYESIHSQTTNVNDQGLRNIKDAKSMESSNIPLRSFPPSLSKPLTHSNATIQPNQLRQQQPQQQQIVSKSNFSSANSNKLLPTTMSMTTPWARKFILSRPKDALLPVPRDFLQDGFNLVQLAPIVEEAVLHSSPISLQQENHHEQQRQQQQQQSNQQFSLYKAALRLILGEDEHDSTTTTSSNNILKSEQQLIHEQQSAQQDNMNSNMNLNSKSSPTTSTTTTTTTASRNHHLSHEYYTPKQIYKAAEVLYTLAHARYVSSPRGLETVRRMFHNHDPTATSSLSSLSSSAAAVAMDDNSSSASSVGKQLEYDAMMTEAIFGRCTRLQCKGMPLLPYGISDDYDMNGTGGMYRKCMRYCCSCGEAFYLWESKVDGSSWGPSFCHLFLLTYGNEIYPILRKGSSSIQRKKSSVVVDDNNNNTTNRKNVIQPKIFGFRIHPHAVIRYPYLG